MVRTIGFRPGESSVTCRVWRRTALISRRARMSHCRRGRRTTSPSMRASITAGASKPGVDTLSRTVRDLPGWATRSLSRPLPAYASLASAARDWERSRAGKRSPAGVVSTPRDSSAAGAGSSTDPASRKQARRATRSRSLLRTMIESSVAIAYMARLSLPRPARVQSDRRRIATTILRRTARNQVPIIRLGNPGCHAADAWLAAECDDRGCKFAVRRMPATA